ncbi:MAG: Ig-like domain-containing protein [Verrucomicrobiota bacterium]
MKLHVQFRNHWLALLGLAWLVLFSPALQAQPLGHGLYVSTPAYGAYVHDLPAIMGSWNRYRADYRIWATYSIDLWLSRKSDNLYWDGSRWGRSVEYLDARHTSDGRWVMTDPRPGRAQLPDGWYGVDVRETRTVPGQGLSLWPTSLANFFGVNSTRRYAMSLFFVDNTPPSLLTITMPPDGGRQSTANVIRGLAADAPGSSGVARVTIAVRQGDLYWDGAAWTGTATRFNATLNGTAWTLSDRMPGRGQLTMGLTYRIEATAEDRGQNTLSVTNSFLADRDTPELSIDVPAPGDVVDELPRLQGTAIDSDVVVRVEVLLRRVGDGLFWSPLARNWSATRSAFTLVPNFRGIWSRTQGLPVGAELGEVEYEVLVTAFDQFGYENSTSGRFTVDKSPPAIATLELSGSLGNLNNIAGRLPGRDSNVRRTNSVQMSLQRQSDSAYWDGSKWTAQESFLDTRLMGNIWTLSSRMPQPGELGGTGGNAGVFNLRTVAFDSFGHRTPGPIEILRVDAMPPSVTVIAPLFSASITAPQSAPDFVLEARELDTDAVKSGVESVVIALTRNDAGVTEYWQWSSAQWGPEAFYNPAEPQAGNPDRWQHIVPDLPPGDYRLFARATDRAGNVGVSSELFRVSGPPGPVVSIDSPMDGTVSGNPLVINGRASDASGVTSVDIIVSRFSGNTRQTYDWARNDFFVYNDPSIQEPIRQAQGTGAWRIDLPATLELGSYEVSAIAVNALNELTEIRSSFQVVDWTPPELGLWYPTNGTPDLTLLTATGWVRDDQPGAQAYVSVMRYRIVSPPEYLDWTHGRWTTQWSDTDTRRVVIPDPPMPDNPRLSSWETSLTEVVDDNGNLQEYGSLFQQGNYAVLASAEDAAGNVSGMALHEFAIADPLPPQVGITTPAAGTIVGTLGTLSGTAGDNPGGSGVGRVEIRLFRQGDATYWNGTGWQSAPFFVRAQIGEGTWSYHRGPQGSDLRTGDYYLEVFAYDQTTRNNFAAIAVHVDRTTPQTLFIASPAHGSLITNLPVIRGSIEDETGGSGPDKVDILVQRDADGMWWDGAAWSMTQTAQPTALSGNDWGSTFSPPPRAALAGGAYTVFAIGYDAAGNRIGVSISLTVPPDTTAPTVYFGEDRSPFPPPPAGPNDVPRLNYPNSQRVAAQFLARLPGVATESFEGLATGSSPTDLTFGTNIATLSGTRLVFTVLDPTMAPGGGFPTTGTNGISLTVAEFGSFTVTFSTPQAAFGFYGTDIEANQFTVRLMHASGEPSDIPVGVVVPQGSGGVFFFGVIDQDRPFSAVEFQSVGLGETFFFDDLTIALPEQVHPGPDGSWAAPQVVLTNTPEAELMVRTGDIDNLGFGWPAGFDPFSGNETPVHAFPWQPDPLDAIGTDRIMVPSSYNGTLPNGFDGYTVATARPDNLPQTITLQYADSLTGITVTGAVLHLFVDDFQASFWGSQFEVTLNGRRAPFLEALINNLLQTGPIGKLITVRVPNDFLSEVASGTLALRIDDTTTGAGDGYAVDFVKLLINPIGTFHAGSISGVVQDEAGQGLPGALVSAANVIETTTDEQGHYTLQPVPAGLTVVTVAKEGYRLRSFNVNVVANVNSPLNATLVLAPIADTVPPVVAFTAPTHQAVVPDLTVLRGTASDDRGLREVAVIILRNSDLQRWNGTDWSTTPGISIPATINPDGSWVYPQGPTRAQLPDGDYTLSAYAIDLAGNFGQAGIVVHVETPVLDTVPPVVAFTEPTHQTVVPDLTVLRGTASDDRGLREVAVLLLRNSDQHRWTGTDWSATGTFIPATLNPDGSWVYTQGPSRAQLADGDYTLTALVTDLARNQGQAAITVHVETPVLDTVPPVVAFTEPTHQAVVPNLTVLRGTASDDRGLRDVALIILRNSDLQRWTGTDWSATGTFIPATLSPDGSWVYTQGPTRAQLADGDYTLTALATDLARNQGQAAITVHVETPVLDTVPPVVAFTAPTHNTVVRDLAEVRGTASDSGGLRQVDVIILRNSDQQFWNGTGWSATQVFVPATLNADGSWEMAQVPPTALLPEGLYTLNAFATDVPGNVGVAGITVRVEAPPAPQPPRLTAIETLATGETRLHANGATRTNYRVDLSEDLEHWSGLGTATTDANGNFEFIDPNAGARRIGFYRLVKP